MKRLPKPKDTMKTAFDACFAGMVTQKAKALFRPCEPALIEAEKEYNNLGSRSQLHLVEQPVRFSYENPIIIEMANKKNLVNLYKYYFAQKPLGRKVYNRIKILGNKRCVFCGGIGHVKNLDHILPKAFFPQLSILPTNLAPICLDCNMGEKGSDFSLSEDEQIIHPYFDDDHFFNEQWISADIVVSDDIALRFYVNPPKHWNPILKKRANHHFNSFGLAERYSLEAATEISTIISARKTSQQRSWDPETYGQHLSEIAEYINFPNSYRKITYQTLSTSSWFCSQDFSNWYDQEN